MARLRTEPSNDKPSPPDEIVELLPPLEYGFSGTVKYYKRENADTIKQLTSLGYTIVTPTDDAA